MTFVLTAAQESAGLKAQEKNKGYILKLWLSSHNRGENVTERRFRFLKRSPALAFVPAILDSIKA